MKVAIIGAGIAGLTTAIALQQAGISCIIYEAAPAIKPLGAGLTLAANAMKALAKLGLVEEILSKGQLLKAFDILDEKGKIITQTNNAVFRSEYGADNFAIHRADLHQVLLSRISPDTVHLNKQILSFEQQQSKVTLHFSDGSTAEADYLLACDGIHSVVRKKVLPEATPRYAGYTCWRAVVNMPHSSQTDALETWGPAGRFGIVPVSKGRIYYFACISVSQPNSNLKNFTISDLIPCFKKYHNPIPEILNQTRNEQLIWNDIYDLKPLRRFAFGNILLLGDAAHATTPNLGQGACQAIEDAVILANLWKQNTRVEDTFAQFEKKRLARTNFVTTQSRRVGEIAQIQNPLLASLRNSVLRVLPASFQERNVKKLLDVQF
ncbi:FAD-dependent monooxygenase [Adhaeribacter radiodurans]|uniref:FAD-dependent monooxygenase n=1 Tax=Adhaeribacter radiodurans TaxID=2745197 RepID=A0A7L7L4M7_9BACT|nr:FAD-dependent monooxygenase [Adhaeribacter radiodurans]QMU27762.1 FAD-dependent monooxygenase [Adhaeribacter radiodurans]